jgi:hypothetical protein
MPPLWRAKSAQGKDAGGPRIVNTRRTEDDVLGGFAAARVAGVECLEGH